MGGGGEKMFHRDLNLRSQTCESLEHQSTNQKNGVTFSLHHSPFTSQNDLFASRIFIITVIIGERGVTHTIAMCSRGPRNPQRFYLNGVSRSSAESFISLTQTHRRLSSLFISSLSLSVTVLG